MNFRRYEAERDFEDVFRIHLEIGWATDTEKRREAAGVFFGAGRAFVADLGGAAESFALTHPGAIRHLEADVPLCVVSAVATSRVGRQQGLALGVTAEAVAAAAIEDGAGVAILGIFDQGFYDGLGFGTGAYDRLACFDPAEIDVAARPRPPVRLGPDDFERVHAARIARRRGHGSLAVHPPGFTRREILARDGGFGLGYEDPATGEITHQVWLQPEAAPGPWWVRWMTWRAPDELRELLALLRAQADQVKLVRLVEPHGVTMQHLLRRPFRHREITTGSKFESIVRAAAWWQARILDLEACLEATRLPGGESLSFNLSLSDPIGRRLSTETRDRWAGVGGDYVVRLGPECAAERRPPDPSLPSIRTSVNTFTRLWLGAARPSDLALTAPDLDAEAPLLERLDRLLLLPPPSPDWDI